MATYQELQDAVAGRVIDLPPYVLADVPRLVNRALRSIQTKHNFKVMETLTSATTAANTRVLKVLPADWKEWNELPYLVTNGGRTKELSVYTNRRDIQLEYGTDVTVDIGEPKALLVSEPTDAFVANIEVYPYSDGNSDYSDGQYRVYIPYYRYLPLLSASDDSNWITVNDAGEEYVIAQATADAFPVDWDEERAAIWAQLAANKRAECILQDKRQRLASTNVLRYSANARER